MCCTPKNQSAASWPGVLGTCSLEKLSVQLSNSNARPICASIYNFISPLSSGHCVRGWWAYWAGLHLAGSTILSAWSSPLDALRTRFQRRPERFWWVTARLVHRKHFNISRAFSSECTYLGPFRFFGRFVSEDLQWRSPVKISSLNPNSRERTQN